MLFKGEKEKVSLDNNEFFATMLLAVLKDYPKSNSQLVSILLSYPKTNKIVKGLLENNVQNLSVDDFENVARIGEFLHECGVFISNYGTSHSLVDFLNLSANLYNRSRVYLKNGTYVYALASVNESATRLRLAQFGINPENNLKKAIELCEIARHEGLAENTEDYAGALMNEGIARSVIAGLGVNPEDNLKKAIELFEKAINEGLKKNSPSYGGALMNENTARLQLKDLHHH